MPIQKIELAVGRPVAFKFPSDIQNIRSASLEGRPVAQNTALGRAYKEFANQLSATAKPLNTAGWISDLRTLISSAL